MDFVIINEVLKQYKGTDAKVIIPDEVKKIAKGAFFNCLHVKEIIFPKGLKKIGKLAFEGCYNLETLFFPAVEWVGLYGAFGEIGDVNIIVPHNKMKAIAEENRYFSFYERQFEETVAGIVPFKALDYVNQLLGVIDKDTMVKIHLVYDYRRDSYEGSFKHIKFNKSGIDLEFYDRSIYNFKMPLRARVILGRLEYPYQLSSEDEERFSNYISRNIKATVDEILQRDDARSLRFLISSGLIHTKNAEKVLPVIKACQLPRCAELAQEIDGLIKDKPKAETKEPAKKTAVKKAPTIRRTAAQAALEKNAEEKYKPKEWEWDRLFERDGVKDHHLNDITYRDSQVTAKPVLVKYVLVQYLKLISNLVFNFKKFQTDYTKAEISAVADELAKKLDMVSLGRVIESILDLDELNSKFTWFFAYCRFGTSSQAQRMIEKIDEWLMKETAGDVNQNQYRRRIIIARGALLLSDTKEAMLFADKSGLLGVYAQMRGESEGSMRKLMLKEYQVGTGEAAVKRFLEAKGLLHGRDVKELVQDIKNAKLPTYQRLLFGEDDPAWVKAQAEKKKAIKKLPNDKRTPEQIALETKCQDRYKSFLMDKLLKDAGVKEAKLGQVKYKDSDALADPIVIKYVLSQYLRQVEKLPSSRSGSNNAHAEVNLAPDADQIADALDVTSLQTTLDSLMDLENVHDNPRILIPYCRYATNDHIKKVVLKMNHWLHWEEFGAKGRISIVVARGGLLLSNTREALLYMYKNDLMLRYATIHKTSEEALENALMVDLGIGTDGTKSYDIGGNTIVASLDADLKISLLNTATGKSTKTFPQNSENPEMLAACTEDFKAFSRDLNRYIASQISILLHDFVKGNTYRAGGWLASHTELPLRNMIARLFVWTHDDEKVIRYFTMMPDGPVDVNGLPLNLEVNGRIGLAHPVEMNGTQLLAWQHYFASRQLNQPFDQIWEPIIPNENTNERYRGNQVPMEALLELTKQGYDFDSSDGSYYLIHKRTYIKLVVSQVDPFPRVYSWRNIGPGEMMELHSVSCPSHCKPRAINNSLYMFDMLVCEQKVRNDDLTVLNWLKPFYAIQVDRLLKLAKREKSDKCAVALADYSEKTFAQEGSSLKAQQATQKTRKTTAETPKPVKPQVKQSAKHRGDLEDKERKLKQPEQIETRKPEKTERVSSVKAEQSKSAKTTHIKTEATVIDEQHQAKGKDSTPTVGEPVTKTNTKPQRPEKLKSDKQQNEDSLEEQTRVNAKAQPQYSQEELEELANSYFNSEEYRVEREERRIEDYNRLSDEKRLNVGIFILNEAFGHRHRFDSEYSEVFDLVSVLFPGLTLSEFETRVTEVMKTSLVNQYEFYIIPFESFPFDRKFDLTAGFIMNYIQWPNLDRVPKQIFEWTKKHFEDQEEELMHRIEAMLPDKRKALFKAFSSVGDDVHNYASAKRRLYILLETYVYVDHFDEKTYFQQMVEMKDDTVSVTICLYKDHPEGVSEKVTRSMAWAWKVSHKDIWTDAIDNAVVVDIRDKKTDEQQAIQQAFRNDVVQDEVFMLPYEIELAELEKEKSGVQTNQDLIRSRFFTVDLSRDSTAQQLELEIFTLENELSQLKGFFSFFKRNAIQKQIDWRKEEIEKLLSKRGGRN